MKIPELLAPAGDDYSFKAAIVAGASAIYFGLENFNARARAKNISAKNFSHLISLAHTNNVRAYLTLNVLIYDEEFEDVIEIIKLALESKIDAVIVQDLGLLDVLSKMFPSLEVHASTQFTTHSIEQCEFLSQWKSVKQINLSRELSLIEMQPINNFLHEKNIKSEVFVHGAFCISFSGQCYFSGCLYGERGNRGECVQPCRRFYKSECNGNKFYGAPFNLRDNNLFALLDKLIATGADSFKIEGRIKSAQYVYAVTSAYREQLNRLERHEKLQMNSELLSKSMNRNFTSGYAAGVIASSMFHQGKKDESVEQVAKVKSYSADLRELKFFIDDSCVKSDFPQVDDLISLKTSNEKFICTAVIEKIIDAHTCKIKITNKLSGKIEQNQIIERTPTVISEKDLQKKIESLQKSNSQLNCRSISKLDVSVSLDEDEKLKCVFKTPDKTLTVFSKNKLSKAETKGLSYQTVKEKLSKLGDTNFVLNELQFDNALKKYFIPLSELNSLRREAVSKLSPQVINYQFTILNFQLITSRNISVIEINSYEVPDVFSYDNLQQLAEKIFQSKSIPLFGAIMIANQMQTHIELLNHLKQNNIDTIICENTGFAFVASQLGFKIILGARLNITNSYSLKAYSEKLNAIGFVLPPELDETKLKQLSVPDNIDVYKIKNCKTPLMQSRQCLVKQMSNCKKEICSVDCILNCEKKIYFTSQQGEKLLAQKRKGFYSAIYDL